MRFYQDPLKPASPVFDLVPAIFFKRVSIHVRMAAIAECHSIIWIEARALVAPGKNVGAVKRVGWRDVSVKATLTRPIVPGPDVLTEFLVQTGDGDFHTTPKDLISFFACSRAQSAIGCFASVIRL